MTRAYHWLALRLWCVAADCVPYRLWRLKWQFILRANEHVDYAASHGATGNGESPW
jgi:hypothetical protein